jgi:uncharacterized protein (TIGR02996 family)
MTGERPFLEAVRAAPDDDGPRLVYADWLDERGDHDRAEFIRVQCELARLDPADAGVPDLHVRQLEMLAEHEQEWLGDWSERLIRWEFRRGFLHAVRITPGPFLDHGEELFRRHPVEEVTFANDRGEPLEPEAVREVVAAPAMGLVRWLDASGCRPDEPMWAMFGGEVATNAWLGELAQASHVTRLEGLSLAGGTRMGRGDINPGVFARFAAAPHLAGLRELDLSTAYRGEGPVNREAILEALAHGAFAANLTSFAFQNHGVEDVRLSTRAGEPRLPSLRVLRDGTPRRPAEGTDLASWPALAHVAELTISDLRINDEDTSDGPVLQLLASPHLSPRLRRLDVSGVCKSTHSVSALAGCATLRGLQWLGFGYNGLTEAKMAALIASPHLGNLEALHMGSEYDWAPERGSGEAERALRLLARSGGFPRLRDVVVGSETPEGAIEALRERFGPRLRVFADC